MKRQPSDRTYHGVGIEWAESLQDDIARNFDRLSCFELIPENFFHGRRDPFLHQLRDSGLPVLVHAVELSIGSAEPLKQRHLENILRVADQVHTINVSDHLCLTEAGGVEIGQLTPLSWNQETCDTVCRKIDQIQAQLDVPFLIENITNRFVVPGAEMLETEFINQILRRTGCYLLLDLNNVHTNAVNFHFNALEWVQAIDLDSVLAVHLAGGIYDEEGDLLDSHNNTVPEAVWDLYRYVTAHCTPTCTIVERTDNTPAYEVLQAEVEQARTISGEKRAPRQSELALGGVR